ncbi:MAG TPA: hypothetical protein VMJ10_36875 [Kofleriaceae bacterium]|nr:hypothetical protein [Kofleriaceae bacterium]
MFSKERALQKTIEKATNKLAQQPDRWGALEKLREDASEEALFGLCKRFGITSMKGVEDEQEKNWVVDVLVEKGAAALPAVRRYMQNADQLAFPLKVLERVADHDTIIEVIDEIFASEKPGYVRMPERRIDLIKWLAEWKAASDDEVISRVTPYLPDFDENVRFTAIDAMATREPVKIAKSLIDALLRPEEESGRIRRTIVEVLEKTKALLGDRGPQVAAMLTGPLANDFKVDAGIVKKK